MAEATYHRSNAFAAKLLMNFLAGRKVRPEPKSRSLAEKVRAEGLQT
jgi:hypothetical protein